MSYFSETDNDKGKMMTEESYNTSTSPKDKVSRTYPSAADASSGYVTGATETNIPPSYTFTVPSATTSVPPTAPAAAPIDTDEYVSTNPMLLPKLYVNDMLLSLRQNQLFKIHAIAALALNTLSFLAWVLAAFFVTMIPWFLIIWAVTGLTLTSHYYVFVRPVPQLLPLHVAWFTVLNLSMVTIWLIAGPYNRAWFLHFLTATSLILSTHYIFAINKGSPNMWFYTHATLAIGINVFLFTLWLDIGKGYPWFLYFIPAAALLLGSHYVFHFKQEHLLLKLHAVLFATIQTILFMAWATTSGFPWFVFPFIAWSAIFAVHVFLTFRGVRSQNTATGS